MRHGTYAGYQWHRKHRSPACDPCLDANAAYRRDYNRRTGWQAASNRALQRLATKYPDDYYDLLDQELGRIPRVTS